MTARRGSGTSSALPCQLRIKRKEKDRARALMCPWRAAKWSGCWPLSSVSSRAALCMRRYLSLTVHEGIWNTPRLFNSLTNYRILRSVLPPFKDSLRDKTLVQQRSCVQMRTRQRNTNLYHSLRVTCSNDLLSPPCGLGSAPPNLKAPDAAEIFSPMQFQDVCCNFQSIHIHSIPERLSLKTQSGPLSVHSSVNSTGKPCGVDYPRQIMAWYLSS